MFLTHPVKSATAERSFSKQKLIKSYLRSTMAQSRFLALGLLVPIYQSPQKYLAGGSPPLQIIYLSLQRAIYIPLNVFVLTLLTSELCIFPFIYTVQLILIQLSLVSLRIIQDTSQGKLITCFLLIVIVSSPHFNLISVVYFISVTLAK